MVSKSKSKLKGNYCFSPSGLDKKFREIIKKTSDGVVIVHIKSRQMCFANEAWLKMMAFTANDLADFKVRDVHPSGYKKEGVEIFKALASGKISQAEKVRFISKKGKILYINVSGFPVDIAGKEYLIAIFNDITDKIVAQEELQKSKEFSDLILDVTPSAVFTVDTKRRITNWNKKAEEITGYKKSEVIGNKCSLFADFPCSERCGLFSSKVARPVKNRECQIKTKDGRLLFVNKNADFLKNKKGEVVGGIESFQDLTARIEAEKAHEESEKRFKEVVENAKEWVWEVDVEGRYTYASSVVTDILGYKPKELVGKKFFFDSFNEKEKEKLKKGAEKVTKQKKPFKNFINKNIHKNGKDVWLSTSGVPVFDDKGRFTGYRGVDADITDQVEAEQALRASESRFKEVVAVAKEWVWEVDVNGLFVYSSSAVNDVLGYQPEELVGKKTIYDLFVAEDLDSIKSVVEKHHKKGTPFKNNVNKNRHKDGSIVWLSTSGVPVFDSNGIFLGYRGVNADITAQIKYENELKAYAENLEKLNDELRVTMNLVQEKDQRLFNSNEELEVTRDELEVMLHQVEAQRQFISEDRDRLSSIFEEMGDGIIMVSSDKKVQLINDRVRKLLGFDSLDSVPEKYLAKFVQKLWKGLDESEDNFTKVEIEIEEPKNAVLVASMARVLSGPEQGGFIGVLRDVSYEKEIEQMRSDFVANVVHDLRSPMAPMKETISLMKDGMTGPLTEQQKKFLSILDNNVDRLLRLVSELLDLSKIEAGKIELKKESVDIVKLVNDAYESVKAYADKKKIELTRGSSEEDLFVKCDSDLITQVVFNLLTNAIKFTPDGGKVGLDVSLSEGEKRKYAVVSVVDNGPGVSQDNIKILFDRYKQLSSTTRAKGTGLGLAISKAIVELHGGDIWVESEVGKGSSFKFRLPA